MKNNHFKTTAEDARQILMKRVDVGSFVKVGLTTPHVKHTTTPGSYFSIAELFELNGLVEPKKTVFEKLLSYSRELLA